MKLQLLFPSLILLLFACKNERKPSPNESPVEAPKQEANTPPTYLEGVYATSTAQGASLQSLFDGDPASVWHTRKGAGPDEGIMLYFENPLNLSTVSVMAEQGSFSEGKGAVIELVGNGIVIGSGNPNAPITVENKPLKSLFIRFQSTGKEGRDSLNDVSIGSYPANFSIGVSEISLRNDKGEALKIVPPQVLSGQVEASSTLKPAIAYSTDNLFDSRKEFCWVEGNPATAGEGERLKFSFTDPKVNISAIQIWNGYQRSDEHFEANARVRDFEIATPDGTVKTYTLRDTKAGQRIELSPAITSGEFTLTVKSIYPGKKYKDLTISEILFFEGERPFIIQSDLSEKIQTETRTKSQSSPLASLLDRRVSNTMNLDGTTLVDQSIILRSDGTFVLYTHSRDANDESDAAFEQKTYADGNWELLRADGKSASVKIFGKWTDVAKLADYYKGVSTESMTRIFSDVLTIEKNKLSGTKMLGTFYIKP